MLNKVILMGRLTRDPELRRTQSGTPVTSFTLAVDRDFKSQGEEKQTDFIDVTCWQKSAEFVEKWFRKGQLVAVTGRLQARKYTDKDGNNRTAFEVVAEETHFAERKSDSPSYDLPPKAEASHNTSPAPALAPSVSSYTELEGDDEDLPF